MEKVRERLKAKLDDLQKRVDKDDGFTFEDTGIDFLMVDEAQQFKNLMFHTGLGRQIRGLSPQGSGRSFELFMKSKLLHERGGRFIMGSGTPLSNSIGELFTISRYMQLDELKALKLHYFDTWANTFGDAASVMEYMPEGGGFRQVTKFKAFVNVADLQRMVYGVMDLATADGVGIERPSIEGDKPEPVVLDMTEAQATIANELGGRAKNIRRNPKDALPDNMLVVSMPRVCGPRSTCACSAIGVRRGRRLQAAGRRRSGDPDLQGDRSLQGNADRLSRPAVDDAQPGLQHARGPEGDPGRSRDPGRRGCGHPRCGR